MSCDLDMNLLSKIALLGLGLDQCFTISYMGLKAPTKALFSMNRCQITVVGRYEQGTFYSAVLLKMYYFTQPKCLII